MALKSKFYEIGSVTTGSDSTLQYLTIQGLSTDYAMFSITFDGQIKVPASTASAISYSWQWGPTVEMQGAWAGGHNASAAKYRNMMVEWMPNNGNTTVRLGNGTEQYVTTSYGRFPRWYFIEGAHDFSERMVMEGTCVLPGDDTMKVIAWNGGGPNPANPGNYGNYGNARWMTYTKLDCQLAAAAPTSIGPMDSIRIGAGTATNGDPLTFNVFSTLKVYGMGWTDVHSS